MPQTAPDTTRREPFAELFKNVGLNPEYMYDFIVAMESAVTKNVVAQAESFRTEVLARFSIQDKSTASLADKVADAEANRQKDFDTLSGKIDSSTASLTDKIDSVEANHKKDFDRLNEKLDQVFKAQDDKFKALIDQLGQTNARIDRMDKRISTLFVIIVGAILTGFVAIIVQALQ